MEKLDPATVLEAHGDVTKKTKTLQRAYLLASEDHPLDFYKELLHSFQEEQLELLEQVKQAEDAKQSKAQATPAKKSHKKKVQTDDNDDLQMPDADEEDLSETTKKSNKRKADDSAEVSHGAFAIRVVAKPDGRD